MTSSRSASSPLRRFTCQLLILFCAWIALSQETFAQPALRINNRPRLPGGVAGQSYTQTLYAAGGTAPYSFQVTNGALPSGVSLVGNQLTGTPSPSDVIDYTFTITVTDAANHTASTPFVLHIDYNPLVFTTASALPAGQVGVPYQTFVSVSGVNFINGCPINLTSGSLPPGFSDSIQFWSTGETDSDLNNLLYGIPTSAGDYTFTLECTAPDLRLATNTFTLHINPASALSVGSPLVVGGTGTALPVGSTGIAYSAQLQATGGRGPYRWAVTGGSLVPGITLGSGGLLHGTPDAAAGPNSVTFTVTDSLGATQSVTTSIQVANPTGVTFNTSGYLPAGVANQPYTVHLHAFKDATHEADSYFITTGSLPQGLSLSSFGNTISGTPTAASVGSYVFTIQPCVSGDCSTILAKSFSLNIYASPLTSGVTSPLPNATVGQPYLQNFNNGGIPIDFTTLESGSLPPGFQLRDANLIGVPTQAGTYTFTLNTDAPHDGGSVIVQTFQLTVNPAQPLTLSVPSRLDGGYTGAFLSQNITFSGGISPRRFSFTGTPPPGAVLTAGGLIRGIPTGVSINNPIQVTVTDSTGATASANTNLSSAALWDPFLINEGDTLPAATVGVPYSHQIATSGGLPIFNFPTPNGLPPGLTLSSTGLLSGTPTSAGTFPFMVSATDTSGFLDGGQQTATMLLSLTVNPAAAPLTITSSDPLPNAIAGVAYQYNLSATGGTGVYNWSVQSGSLPTGFTLDSSAGVISSSTSTVAGGPFTFTLLLQDSGSNSTTKTFHLTIGPSTTILPATLPNGTVGTSYSQQLSGSGGSGGPYTAWSVTSGALPTGLSISSNGLISGTPTATGPFNFTITALDSGSHAGSRAYTVTIGSGLTIQTSPAPPSGYVNSPYSATLSASGGTQPYSNWIVTGGSLPAGLTLSSAGVISGTPTTASPGSPFTVQVTDGANSTATAQFTIPVFSPVSISPSTLPDGVLGTPYSQQLTPSGGAGNYGSWQIIAGALPTGLSLSSSGVISGTPNTAGPYNFTVQVLDTNSHPGTQAYSVTISPILTIGPATLPNGTSGTSYSQTLTATGGTPPYGLWQISTGSLPPGLNLDPSSGVISGTPTANGPFNFTVQITDCGGQVPSGSAFRRSASPISKQSGCAAQVATKSYTLTIGAATLTISPSTLPNGTVGAGYNQPITASNGLAPYSFSISAGALPAGLTLSSSGTLSGTPTTAGPANFTIKATDSASNNATQSYSITINSTLAISTPSLPNGVVGTSYSQPLSASGGALPYTNWSIFSGSLPTGLNISSTGVISGTPTAAGPFNFTVQVTDSAANTATKAYSVTIASVLAIGPASLPNGTAGSTYNQPLSATGGTSPYSNWQITTGALPTGLTLNSNSGAISGTPTTNGPFSFTVQVSDSGSQTATKAYTLTIGAATLAIAPSTLPNGVVGQAYNQPFTASNGLAPYSFSVSAGALPAGLSLSSGVLSGTPTTAGPASFTIKVNDSASNSATQAYSITINSALAIGPSTLPDGTAGSAYNQPLTATNGTAPYHSWQISTGALPPGLNINSNSGVISGTPTGSGLFNFTVQVSDSGSQTATQAYTLNIKSVGLGIAPATLPQGVSGVAYSQALSVSNGLAPYSYSLSSGTLPTGISLSSGGLISGTTTQTGAFPITVAVKDAANNNGTQTYTLTVNPALAIGPSSLANGFIGIAYNQALSATGGVSPYSNWIVTTGSLPTGLTLSSGGAISGTPTTSGPFSFTVQVSDSASNTATKSYTVTISNGLGIQTTALTPGVAGSPYSQAITVVGGAPPYSGWTVSNGSLPAGLTLDSSGTISGTPTYAGSSTFTISVTDTASNKASQTYTLTVNPALSITTATALPAATARSPYTQAISATGGISPYRNWVVTSGALPAGLTLNSANGALTGIPLSAGNYSFTIQTSDSATPQANTASKAFTLAVSDTLVITNLSTLPGGAVGLAYSVTFNVTGGTPPIGSWAVSSGVLPPGLSLNPASGQLSGTPTAQGNYSFTILVTDSANGAASKAFSLAIGAGLTIVTPSPLPAASLGSAYSQPLTVTGGFAPYTWSVISGVLPAGLSLNPTSGQIGGTPTSPGSSTFTVQVQDSNQAAATKQFSLTVSPAQLAITTPAQLPAATVGQAYTQGLAASGGITPYQWILLSGALPQGVSLAQDGTLSGTPATAGTYTFGARATDAQNISTAQSFTLQVNAASLVVSTSALPDGAVGAAYSQTLSAAGGVPGYTWALAGGALPAGLSLASNGAISGTPNGSGPATFTVQVTDSKNATATKQFTLNITATGLSVTTSSLPDATVGSAYSQSVAATGGTSPYTWTVTAGALPGGLSLSSAGAISGTPAAAGASTFTVQVTDSKNISATRQITINVKPSVLTITTTSPLTPGTVGSAYSQSLAAAGGTSPYAFSLTSGALPAGVTLAANGALSGTPGASGTFSFTVQVTDSKSATASAPFSLTIKAATLNVTTASLPAAAVGSIYSQTLTAAGGSGTYSWSLANGALPQGLSLTSAGLLSGTPLVSGSSTFTVQVSDGVSTPATKGFTLTVNAAALQITTSDVLTSGTVNGAYALVFTASGGVAPYKWLLAAGSLPAGLTLQSNGVLGGVANAPGTSNFTVQATDASNTSVSKTFKLTINAADLQITTPSTLSGQVNTPYSLTFSVIGGTPSYTWSVSAGSLPQGLFLTSTGLLSGTPSVTGTTNFTVQAVDAANVTATKLITFTVSSPQISLDSNLTQATAGTPYSQKLAVNGGTPPYSNWTITSGSLPPGLTLDASSGTISGTPTTAGSYTFSVKVTDASNQSASQSYALTVAAPKLSVTTTSLSPGTVGTAYTAAVAATGGTQPYTFAVDALPAGLTISSTGAISGTPTAAFSGPVTITVTDKNGQTAKTTLTLTIATASNDITSTSPLPDATGGTPYSYQLQAAKLNSPLSWSIIQGALPLGLTLDPVAGLISGTPAEPNTASSNKTAAKDAAANSQTYSFRVQVSRADLGKAVKDFQLTVNPATGTFRVISVTPLPNGTVSKLYLTQILTVAGQQPYQYSLSDGVLPPGLSLSGDGTLTGTPTQAGPYHFTVQITDASGKSLTFPADVTIQDAANGPVITSPAQLPIGTTGKPYSQQISVTGGTPPYAYSVVAGELTPGISFDPSTGILSGTPPADASSRFTVQVVDAAGLSDMKTLLLAVTATGAALTAPAATLPAGTAGLTYNALLTATGGKPPYQWSQTGGSLPQGITLGPDGTLAGTAGAPGTYTFTAQVIDGNGFRTTAQYTVTFSLPAAASGKIQGLPATLGPQQQASFTLDLDAPYPLPISGTVTLSFTPNSATQIDDPSLQFSLGGRTANFTIPAGQTRAVFSGAPLALQTGTSAGTITLHADLFVQGTTQRAGATPDTTITLPLQAPVILSATAEATATGFNIIVTGYSNTREISEARVRFTPAAGQTLSTTDVTINVTSAFQTWYNSSDSKSFGSQFRYVQPFTVSNGLSILQSMTITLKNGQGNSAETPVKF